VFPLFFFKILFSDYFHLAADLLSLLWN